MVIKGQSKLYNIKLSDVAESGFSFYLPDNIVDEAEYEYYLASGSVKSNSRYFTVSSPLTPVIKDLEDSSLKAGDILKIFGRNLQPGMTVHFGDIVVSPDSVVDGEATITVPANAVSGFLYVESLQLISNKIYFDIKETITLKSDSIENIIGYSEVYVKDNNGKSYFRLTQNGVNVDINKNDISYNELYIKNSNDYIPTSTVAIFMEEKSVEINAERLALSNILLIPSISKMAASDA